MINQAWDMYLDLVQLPVPGEVRNMSPTAHSARIVDKLKFSELNMKMAETQLVNYEPLLSLRYTFPNPSSVSH